MTPRDARFLAGSILVLAGAAALAAALAGYIQGAAWQKLESAGEDPLLSPKGSPLPPLRAGEPFARLTIPRIGLDVMVIEGTRKEDLLKGPGHLVGSASAGGGENCIIAGHRDLHFRALGRLAAGDLIRLEAGGRESEYRVEATQVVSPDDTAVLDAGREAFLTLVTCYPFRYVGPAPKRFVVRARLVRGSDSARATPAAGSPRC